MKFRPVDDRILIKAQPVVTKSKGGIALVASLDKEFPLQGEIVACGVGRRDKDGKLVPLDVKVGDVAIFERNVACEVTLEGELYNVVREADILAVLTK